MLWRPGMSYPNGTLLCNHKCVQPTSPLGKTSEIAKSFSLGITDWVPPSLVDFRLSSSSGNELFFWILPADPEEITYGLNGDVGELFRDSTEGGGMNEAGARTVIVRSSDVKFEAWRVNTWQNKIYISFYSRNLVRSLTQTINNL